ncbi:uncharacterized protein V1518DRAFT_436041 [Limtongia smithiae]|uniref:uncharacterized protein n=1 Tax=Limtongia smithiae TaxID=1125753 RepID=UPI0034CD85A3
MAAIAIEEADFLVPPAPIIVHVDDFRHPTRLRHRVREYLDTVTQKQKFLGGALLVLLAIGTLLFLIFHKQIFAWISPFCEKWSEMRGGSLLLALLISATSFPPIIGYTSAVTIAGMVYGLWKGWIISMIATVVASYACFIASRAYFANFAYRLAETNSTFQALAMTLEYDGLKLLWMIRMSPLPFSFSNAALSTIHTITPQNFAIATLLSTPKLLMPIFIGSRLRNLSDEKLRAGTKFVNVLSIIISATIAVATGWIIFHQTTERARQLRGVMVGVGLARYPTHGSYSDHPEEDSDEEFFSQNQSNGQKAVQGEQEPQHQEPAAETSSESSKLLDLDSDEQPAGSSGSTQI